MNIHNPEQAKAVVIPMLKSAKCTHYEKSNHGAGWFDVFGIEQCSKCNGMVRMADTFRVKGDEQFLINNGFKNAAGMNVATDGYYDDDCGDCCSNCS